MTEPRCTEEQFLKDVKEHTINIIKEDGFYRHLRFRQNDSFNMAFDIITWPGHLCYTGDCGTYTFSRLEDMFQFFRAKENDGLRINPSYWSEKVTSMDREGVKEYCPERLKEVVMEYLDEKEPSAELMKAIREEILDYASGYGDGDEGRVRQAVDDFEHEDVEFSDFWERDLTVWTGRYLWCCYAIMWAIEKYDKAKEEEKKLAEGLDKEV